MKSLKNKRTSIMIIVLLGLLVLAYKVMFAPADDGLLVEENIIASQRVERILKEIESVNFDTSIMEDESFQSLMSIETPLISLPVGRRNPFSSSFNQN